MVKHPAVEQTAIAFSVSSYDDICRHYISFILNNIGGTQQNVKALIEDHATSPISILQRPRLNIITLRQKTQLSMKSKN